MRGADERKETRGEREEADILIVGARVCDGAGEPWFPANVAIKDDRIQAVGVSVNPPARRRIDAGGLVLSPGFIDVHTHADRDILKHPAADNFLVQGVTTVVGGNCGASSLPIGQHLDLVEQARPAVNYATLAGHGTLRREVMGMAAREPDRKELSTMCRLAGEAMHQGALGMSTGLFYVPGAWAECREIVGIAREVAAWGGLYATHKRSAGGQVFEAVTEAANVGLQAGIAVQISHLKVLHRRGRTTGERMEEVIAHIQNYREQGVDIAWDVHPYPATQTRLSSVVIPEWVSEGGKLSGRLKDDAIRERIHSEVAGKMAWIGGADKIQIADPEVGGQTLAELAKRRGTDPVSAAMDLTAEVNPRCIFHALRREDVDMALMSDPGMVASDGGVVSGLNLVHPRNFGTFPRVLGDYVRERRLLGLEAAVRKMTFMPARRLALADRGLIAPGMKADIVLFDPQIAGSQADFEHYNTPPDGIHTVLVNGKVALAKDRADSDTGRFGEILRGPQRSGTVIPRNIFAPGVSQ